LKKSNKGNKEFTVLIAPLDWGLGHATRSIPLISFLKNQQIRVLVCGNGAIKELLQQEFPDLEILTLRGYNIQYSQNGKSFLFNMLLQIPKIIFSVWYENRWLKRALKKYHIDAVISDNRLGCFNKSIPSVFITHQLNIKTGYSWVDKFIRRLNYFFINQFEECWVPDYSNEKCIAGELSHPSQYPTTPVKYIGLMSRFKKSENVSKFKVCFLLSGPEPQRTILENKILQELELFNDSAVIIRGIPNKKTILRLQNKNITQYNHLNANELCTIIQESEFVIARSGYSTIMDLISLEKNAVLIPTPGQTEQEYLGRYLNDKGLFYSVSQDKFNLHESLQQLYNKPFEKSSFLKKYKETVTDWIIRAQTARK
jgi:uncharacterized protein (TIGR00661 family)